MNTLTLTDFLLARLAEDEAVARGGISGQADPENGWGYGGFGSPKALTPHVGMIHEAAQAQHIIRWHPARVLAEVAAKRRIVERYAPVAESRLGFDDTLCDLASVYADHDDYDEEWAL